MICKGFTTTNTTQTSFWSQYYLMVYQWGDTMPGPCLTTLSGHLATLKSLDWQEWILLIQTGQEHQNNLSNISASSSSKTDFQNRTLLVDCWHFILINWKFYLSDWLSRQGFGSEHILWMFDTKTVLWWIALGIYLQHEIWNNVFQDLNYWPFQKYRLLDQALRFCQLQDCIFYPKSMQASFS